jgi:membrane-associated phospholipid phosphatase
VPGFWNFVTDFGDTAVTLPLAALTLAFLLLSGWQRAALSLAIALAACGIAIGLTKLALESCGTPLLHTEITNPSGHAAVSTTVYGSLAMLFAGHVAAERRWIPIATAALLLIAIALSRVILDAHSSIEVALGLAIGLGALVLFHRSLAAGPTVAIHGLWLALGAVAVIALMHGARWPIEDIVRAIVHLIRHSVPACA